MHVPSSMLNGAICPVSAAVSAVGVAGAAAMLVRGKSKIIPSAGKFAMVSALVFALQMLNYPIWDGISGHLIGGVLAAVLLGTPAAVVSLALVLTCQTLLFADGGILMLGANVLNMALIGAGVGGLLRERLLKRKYSNRTATGIAAALSVMLAATALVLELAASGKATLEVAGTLLGVHLVLAVIEGAATVMLIELCTLPEKQKASRFSLLPAALLILVALAAAPFASAFPDAFEWTMEHFQMLPDAPNFVNAPFADYVAFGSEYLAGIFGVAAVAVAGFVAALLLGRKVEQK